MELGESGTLRLGLTEWRDTEVATESSERSVDSIGRDVAPVGT